MFQCGSCFGYYDYRDNVYRKLYNTTLRFVQSFQVPYCYQIILNQNNIQSEYISSKGLTGRFLPAGTFPSTILALEYVYGLACPIPNIKETGIIVESFNLTRVAYDKNYLITRNEVIVNFTGNIRLTLLMNLAFDRHYKLCGYDGQIRNLGLTFDTYTEIEHQTIIGRICAVTQIFCNGTLQQYNSVDACKEYLTRNLPYGTYDRADQGNVVCRIIHAGFVPLLPSVHCPHVGPNGGGACTDKTINFYYEQPDFLGCAHKYI